MATKQQAALKTVICSTYVSFRSFDMQTRLYVGCQLSCRCLFQTVSLHPSSITILQFSIASSAASV